MTGVIKFSAAPSAPRSAKASFTRALVGGAPKGLKVAQLRRIGVETFPGQAERLFVAPVEGGGFCYEWAYAPAGTSSWITELGGCSTSRVRQPLLSSFDDTRVSIVAVRALADSVSVKLSDGSVVEPSLLWVSTPISAGFWLYQPPSGLHVEVDAMQHGKIVDRHPITRG